MVKLPIEYIILNTLREPHSPCDLADKLNIDIYIAELHCRALHHRKEIKVHSRTKNVNNTWVYTYISVSNKKYGVCNKCECVLEIFKLTNGICVDCINIDELDYANIGTSLTQIQHMQRIINDQKKIIKELQTELYLLKHDKGI